MAMMEICRGDILDFLGVDFEFLRRIPDGRLQAENVVTGEIKTFTDDELAKDIVKGTARIIRQGMRLNRRSIAARELRERAFSERSEGERQQAQKRLYYLTELRKRGVESQGRRLEEQEVKKISIEIGDKQPPSMAAIYRWRKRAGPNIDIKGLVGAKRGTKLGERKLSPEVVEVMQRVIKKDYMRAERPTAQAAYDTVCSEILDNNKFRESDAQLAKPSYAAFLEEISRFNAYEMTVSRYGKAVAEARFAASGVSPKVTSPLELVEVDHTKLDIFVVDGDSFLPLGRPWFVIMVDRYSRMPVGMHLSFDPPSTQTVIQCLKNAICPKDYIGK